VPVLFAGRCPPQALRERLPALLFSPAVERKVLAALFPRQTAVTLYGHYGEDVTQGVDARDLSRFADASFSAHLSMVLFDYFTEHEAALAEAFRVLAPGGLFATLILDNRIRDGAPHVVKTLEKKPGYYDYWPEGTDILSIGVGAAWLVQAMRAAGFADAAHIAIADPISDYVSHWFVGIKPVGLLDRLTDALGRRRAAPPACTICGTVFPPRFAGGDCPVCKSPARLRSLPVVWDRIAPQPLDGPLLGFALSGAERAFLAPRTAEIVSVSLYGDYGAGHIAGVDVRDLSRFAPARFGAVFSILLFDYFAEHDQALAEIARVLKPGGVFATAILDSRLGDDAAPPSVTKTIQSKPGYFDYVPAETSLVSIRVGRAWFLAAMEQAGLAAQTVTLTDPASRERTTWFIGHKR
jgi:ubiquinone/menaquinone biosynthesis C-methylase UbiE